MKNLIIVRGQNIFGQPFSPFLYIRIIMGCCFGLPVCFCCFCGNPPECPRCHIARLGVETFPTASRSSIIANIRPLDCLFFSSGSCSSGWIRRIQANVLGHGEFSHAAVVVDASIMPIKEGKQPAPTGKLYVLEATRGITAPDTELEAIVTGVQIRDLEKVLDEYEHMKQGVVAWCKLKDNPLDGPNARKIGQDLNQYYEKIIHKSYEFGNLHHMLLTIAEKPFKHATDNTYFCSELVAGVYQKAGLFEPKLDIETVAPVEIMCNAFKVSPKFDTPVVITKDVSSEEERLKQHQLLTNYDLIFIIWVQGINQDISCLNLFNAVMFDCIDALEVRIAYINVWWF
eukprot:TRINITY_DN1019_c0_g1_i2.p2 TRINITY_DN1019_c0_g1~~TRINITY_DN1019_c0_g1_i2.p2  ORF type:complete len:343 (-),score=9.99 TRINITY_DN1019_c0_g1_i2:1313-2341(-)